VNVPQQLIDKLESARNAVIAGHVSPDVDALASMLALAHCLPAADTVIALPGKATTQRLQFILDLKNDIAIADPDCMAASEMIVVVDTAVTKRINIDGKWESATDKFVVNIDHHITNTDFGHINWIEDNASSTSEMIYYLIRTAGWPLDEKTATILYAGIYADTDGFSLPNATAETFEAAASLVRSGANIEHVGEKLRRSQDPHQFDLIRTVYHNTRLTEDKNVAYSTLSHDDISGAGCIPEDIDDQVSIPRSLSGIKVAILFSEGHPGIIRINLRGEEGTPVLPIAQKLGGGGHTHSAGVRIKGKFDEVVKRVLDETTDYLNQ